MINISILKNLEKEERSSVKTFNSFQIVAAYTAWPFLISWLDGQSFRGSSVAFWASIIAYIVACIFMIIAVRMSLDEKNW